MNKLARTIPSTVALAVSIAFAVLLSLAEAGTPSVPNLINFQARITGAGGAPVANGTYNSSFSLYPNQSGGASLWSEGPVSVITSSGSFTHALGSSAPLPLASELQDSLWLEITFNGEVQAPRLRIVGSAYARLADALEVRTGTGAQNFNAIETDRNQHRLSCFGSDGLEKVRIWGTGHGELLLSAGDLGATDPSVYMSSNAGNGGVVTLRNVDGNIGLHIHAGLSGSGATLSLGDGVGGPNMNLFPGFPGDASVQFPVGAISSVECNDEAGLAGTNTAGGDLIIYNDTLAQAMLSLPSGGYVLALATLELENAHPGISVSSCTIGLSDSTGIAAPSNQVRVELPSGGAFGTYRNTVSVHAIFGPYPPSMKLIYLVANDTSSAPSFRARNTNLSLVYLPTVYGAIDPPAPTSGVRDEPNSDLDASAGRARADALTLARFQHELELVRSQAAATTRRLAELEAMIPKQQAVSAVANPEY